MSVKRVLLLLGVVVLGAALFLAGTAFAQSGWGNREDGESAEAPCEWGPGHMEGWEEGDGPYQGMMGGAYGSMMGGAYGDMMDGDYDEMMDDFGGAMGPAMMGGWGGLVDVAPMSLGDAQQAVEAFLQEQDEQNLAVGEIMIFENHAYAEVVDTDSGTGAFEVLVDPQTGNVYPEPGPNMMWNTTYGHAGAGMMGMMGGQYGDRYGSMMGGTLNRDEAEVAVDETEAVTLAQAYLDEFLPGATADEHADVFPGYYTLHVQRDGQIVGMLSVNAFSGDVFPHTWHGDFVEMSAEHAD